MPTSFTDKIYKGQNISMEEFILTCARAFGATIMMRDEPLDKPIPEFQPSTFYLDSMKEAERDLEMYRSMTLDKVSEIIEDNYRKTIEDNERYYNEQAELKIRYEQMIKKVELWNPPTEEHVNLKDYCLNQLRQSLESDCYNIERYLETPVKQDPEKWLNDRIEWCEDNIKRYSECYQEEVERTNSRNLWVKQLKDSLKN